MIQDTGACQAAFDFERDVPTCLVRATAAASRWCRSGDRGPYSRAPSMKRAAFYASFPFDSGHNSSDSAFWEFFVPLRIDGPGPRSSGACRQRTRRGSMGQRMRVDPDRRDAGAVAASVAPTGVRISFMLPVQPMNLAGLKRRGAKVIVYHGVSDAIFRSTTRRSGTRSSEPRAGATRRTSRASSGFPAWPIARAARRPISSTC